MCGICGKVFFNKDRFVDQFILKNMTDVMGHRGPDDEGYYISGHVGLGHKRLSIIDLHTGKQPIYNEDGRICIIFNGEIYNYQEIRRQLMAKGHFFKTETDTEVIIHAYEEYGEDCVTKLRGMFAFAIWDDRDQTLLLARDRVGIKPLYYSLTSNSLIFASEIKAIIQDPSVPRDINYPIIDRFLTYLYTPGDQTLFKNIYKLSPGHYLILKNGRVTVKQYWDLDFSSPNPNQDFVQAKDNLFDLLKESVRLHMISDVPIGILLSGGVDSTALLSLSKMETSKDLSTFTIGFEGENFADERIYARLAAKRFATKHYEMTIKSKDFVDFLPKYVWHMEEPVCEPPAIALYYISKLAKDHVKVLISGEGGDEAFAGYQNYRNLIWLERFKKMAGPLNGTVSSLFDRLSHFGPFKKFGKYSPLLTLPLERYYYSRTSSPFSFFNKEFGTLYSSEFKKTVDKGYSIEPTKSLFRDINSQDNLSKMLYVDTKTWLPDDLLIKADKITMANSIELRVPLLDHKVLEFAAGLPAGFKVKGVTNKYILKKAFQNIVPREILKRKKTGFPVPYDSWFRNELYDKISDVLLDQKTLERDYFDKASIKKLVQNYFKNSIYSKEVFSMLILELWHRVFIDKDPLSF